MVLITPREAVYLVFDGRAITDAGPFYNSGEQGRPVEIRPYDVMSLLVRISYVAW